MSGIWSGAYLFCEYNSEDSLMHWDFWKWLLCEEIFLYVYASADRFCRSFYVKRTVTALRNQPSYVFVSHTHAILICRFWNILLYSNRELYRTIFSLVHSGRFSVMIFSNRILMYVFMFYLAPIFSYLYSAVWFTLSNACTLYAVQCFLPSS